MKRPRCLDSFCRELLPRMVARTRGRRMVRLAGSLVETDRPNSFDGFSRTNRRLAEAFREAGATSEISALPTGGPVGNGRWVMQNAWNVVGARAEVVSPVRRRLFDWSDNPFHVAQLSGSTPPGGVECELVVVDSREQLGRLGADDLSGKLVLTRLLPYPYPYNQGERHIDAAELHARGAAGVLSDAPVPGFPGAVIWSKLGWGSLWIGRGSARPPCLIMSARQGRDLRRLLARSGRLRVRLQVDVRLYSGCQEAVSGLVTGCQRPEDEVWAIAHSAEPGAVDNASGLAVLAEVAGVLEGLIGSGELPRPRRTIRLLAAYECYGFFAYLERVRRPAPPLAGVCIDGVGLRPDRGGLLEWHASVPGSAGFADDLGEAILRAALRAVQPGYRYVRGPFVPTDDTLIGDPQFGFPCPWIYTGHYRGYHSSADTPELLSPRGLAACAAGMAGYLYFLANMSAAEAVEVARWQSQAALAELAGLGRRPLRGSVGLVRQRHGENLRRLRRWMPAGTDSEGTLDELGLRLSEAASRLRTRSAPADRRTDRRVPTRTAPLVPTPENLFPETCARLAAAAAPAWSLYLADGRRSIGEIAELTRAQSGRDVPTEKLSRRFEILEELGYVRLSGRLSR